MAKLLQEKSYECAKFIRSTSLKLVHKANASHIASALSIADILAVIFSHENLFNLPSIDNLNRDRFLLSKGHACVALYSALHYKKFFLEEDLFTYGEDYSNFMNHASHKVPGVEFSTGALGHALPVACGMAYAAKLKKEVWKTFVLMSDGELQEGSNWEAMLFANQFKLDNLIIFIDHNNLQSLTTVDETISIQPIEQKFKAFGLHTESVDGHNHLEIFDAIQKSIDINRPVAIICNTCKGKGVSFMENKVEWHYKSPNKDELQIALEEVKNS